MIFLTHSLRLHDFLCGGCMIYFVDRFDDFFWERCMILCVERLRDFCL